MGAWGNKNFDNDDAMDFLASVQEQGQEILTSTIVSLAAKKDTDYIDASEAAECLAAIEYFAASNGKPSDDFPEEASEWLKEHLPLPVIDIGVMQQVLTRIKTNSELQELWEESGEFVDWQTVVNDLQTRIA